MAQHLISLGDLAMDTITKYSGVVVADCTWLNGCRRLTLQPKALHEGKPVESHTFDVEQLVLVKGGSTFEGNRALFPHTPTPTPGFSIYDDVPLANRSLPYAEVWAPTPTPCAGGKP